MLNFLMDNNGVIDVDAALAYAAQHPAPVLDADPVTPRRQPQQTPVVDTPDRPGPDFFRGFCFLVPTSQRDLPNALLHVYNAGQCLLYKAIEHETYGSGQRFVEGYIYLDKLYSERHMDTLYELPGFHGCVWKGTHLHYTQALQELDRKYPHGLTVAFKSCLPDDDDFDSQATTLWMESQRWED